MLIKLSLNYLLGVAITTAKEDKLLTNQRLISRFVVDIGAQEKIQPISLRPYIIGLSAELIVKNYL